MKFTRLNDDEIRCVLTEDELGDFGIDLDDIITKNNRTANFFKTLLSEAAKTLGMSDASEIRMASAQISVLKDNSISIVFHGNKRKLSTEVRREILDMMEEQLRLGGNDSPEAMSELQMLRDTLDSEDAMTAEEKQSDHDSSASVSFMAAFRSLEDTIHYSRAVRAAEKAESRLYVSEKRDVYYLLVMKNTLTDLNFRRSRLIAMEFGDVLPVDTAGKAYIAEKNEVLIANGALKKLAELGD